MWICISFTSILESVFLYCISVLIFWFSHAAMQKLTCKWICFTSAHSEKQPLLLQRNLYAPNNSISYIMCVYDVSFPRVVVYIQSNPPRQCLNTGTSGEDRRGSENRGVSNKVCTLHCATPCDSVCVPSCSQCGGYLSPGAGTVPCCSQLWAILDGLCH